VLIEGIHGVPYNVTEYIQKPRRGSAALGSDASDTIKCENENEPINFVIDYADGND